MSTPRTLLSLALAGALLSAGCSAGRGSRVGEPSARPPSSAPGTAPPSAETSTYAEGEGWPEIVLEPRWSGVEQPLCVTAPGDGSGRLFIAEKTGRIRIVKDGKLLDRPFLDLSRLVSRGGEQGLLGLAFPPGFRSSGRFYVDYTDRRGDTVVARYRVRDGDPEQDVAGSGSEGVILEVDQPFSNHNGGCLQFDSTGMLLVGLGDGGAGGDPLGNGQDPRTLLGKILRLDVGEGPAGSGDTDSAAYTSPGDNPRLSGWRPEILAMGLRNPWRFSFDRSSGDLWIGDVGQNAREEIDVLAAGWGRTERELDFGWSLFEGSAPYPPSARRTRAERSGVTMPVAEYGRDEGQSVTGGYVYRGRRYPRLRGMYLYADFVSGRLWGLKPEREGGSIRARATKLLAETGLGISSFGEDEDGELYVCDLTGGAVYSLGVR